MTEPVDTVLVAYRSESVIGPAVDRALALGGRVVVVDHGDGESAVRAAAAGAIAIHDPSNPGFGTGQNRGVAFTDSAFVLLCNPDAEIDPAAVRRGAEFLAAHPDVAAVQGVVVNRTTGAAERSQGVAITPLHLVGRAVAARHLLTVPAVRRLARRSAMLRDHADRVPAGPTAVETLAATVLLVRRTAFDSIGGFDAGYFLYGEDVDFCRRLRDTGWSLMALPEVWAVHDAGGSAESSVSRELHWWAGTMRYAACWWGTGAWVVALGAAGTRAARLTVSSPRRLVEVWTSLVGQPLHARRRSTPAAGWSI